MSIPLPAIPETPGPDLPDPAEAPTPSGHHAKWFPAMVDVPGLDRMPRARAYATPDGLYLWTRKPREGEQPDVWLPILWELTGPLPKGAQARIQGVYLATEQGLVHITPSGGCGCGSPLRQWAPSWASTSLAGWPGSAPVSTAPEQVEYEDDEDDLDPPDAPADAEPAS